MTAWVLLCVAASILYVILMSSHALPLTMSPPDAFEGNHTRLKGSVSKLQQWSRKNIAVHPHSHDHLPPSLKKKKRKNAGACKKTHPSPWIGGGVFSWSRSFVLMLSGFLC